MTKKLLPQNVYIGRFAPSPTGKLHFGSLVSAVASYVDAKANRGKWLVRMEDLDPPREEPGAADSIIRSLEAHYLLWDDTLLYQSQRLDAYEDALSGLHQYLYPCSCKRQRIIELGGTYDGYCLKHPPNLSLTTATRIKITGLPQAQRQLVEHFNDLLLGPQENPLSTTGDFILRRKDQLFAYQLAVAIDDDFQHISHVIRGRDLLDSTSRQRYILALIGAQLPEYGHTPLALGQDGDKLSKQTKAPEIQNNQASENLIKALDFLGHPPPKHDLADKNCSTLLEWAIAHWDRDKIPKHSSVAPKLSSA